MRTCPIVTATLDVRRLPGLRRQIGLTQVQLAERAGTTPAEVSRVESALRPQGILDRMIDALAAAAGEVQNG
jgi:transcriptional regulator with XRE-family HTH domain